jgi:hypothetical protein
MLGLMNRTHGRAAYSRCEMLEAWEKEAKDRVLATLRLTAESLVADPFADNNTDAQTMAADGCVVMES